MPFLPFGESLTRSDVELFTQDVAIAALASANATLRETKSLAEYAATHDPLTGLLNRRAFAAALQGLQNNRHRRGQEDATNHPNAIIMVDIDHFKRVNDTHGHLAGDAVLKQLADILAGGVRQRDVVARFGGEEFALLLPRAATADAVQVAEKLREKIMEADLVTTDGVLLQQTCSFGVAEVDPSQDLDTNLGRADQALYMAKKNGRNQTVSFS